MDTPAASATTPARVATMPAAATTATTPGSSVLAPTEPVPLYGRRHRGVLIGRHPHCNYIVQGTGAAAKKLSRRHALVMWDAAASAFRLCVLGLNGVTVAGRLCFADDDDHPLLEDGTIVEFPGDLKFVFRGDAPEPATPTKSDAGSVAAASPASTVASTAASTAPGSTPRRAPSQSPVTVAAPVTPAPSSGVVREALPPLPSTAPAAAPLRSLPTAAKSSPSVFATTPSSSASAAIMPPPKSRPTPRLGVFSPTASSSPSLKTVSLPPAPRPRNDENAAPPTAATSDDADAISALLSIKSATPTPSRSAATTPRSSDKPLSAPRSDPPSSSRPAQSTTPVPPARRAPIELSVAFPEDEADEPVVDVEKVPTPPPAVVAAPPPQQPQLLSIAGPSTPPRTVSRPGTSGSLSSALSSPVSPPPTHADYGSPPMPLLDIIVESFTFCGRSDLSLHELLAEISTNQVYYRNHPAPDIWHADVLATLEDKPMFALRPKNKWLTRPTQWYYDADRDADRARAARYREFGSAQPTRAAKRRDTQYYIKDMTGRRVGGGGGGRGPNGGPGAYAHQYPQPQLRGGAGGGSAHASDEDEFTPAPAPAVASTPRRNKRTRGGASSVHSSSPPQVPSSPWKNLSSDATVPGTPVVKRRRLQLQLDDEDDDGVDASNILSKPRRMRL
ncbi:hypothetical protein H9P43_006221 [Blastocladiella emersonii ATCC 22665]|nr:hypothetical protein H9P43_006221 [Blastocladiella emersonii ATCC 22665]